ncbi:MAG: TatD family hydrolase [Lachnospiraceae bacterium]|jgi:TatD DNase family protein|nr:TatD family hydrolase [Lachnospiraceae bacterium]
MIFDTHTHYDDRKFEEDRDKLLSSLKESNITKIVNVGADIETTKQTLALAAAYDFIYAAVGVHPSDVDCLNEENYAWLKRQTSCKKVVAVGEIGLDYYWEKDPQKQQQQKYWFQRQLSLAKETNLPVVIHSRDAAEDTLNILKEQPDISGVIHCFSYSKELALEYVKMGYYIGVGGVITFKNAKKLKEAVEAIPLERIVIETDCPYLAPEPYRGKRNESIYLPYVLNEIARIKHMTPAEIEDVTFHNAEKLYCI